MNKNTKEEMSGRLNLTEDAERMIESSEEEPFRTFNCANHISAERFLSILEEIENFILKFERRIGMRSASKWIGERLNDAVDANRTTVRAHLDHAYFSMFDIRTRTAFILMENYEVVQVGFVRRRYDVYNLSVPRFILTRIVHEDTHAHLLSAEYASLYSELLRIAMDEMKKVKVRDNICVRKLPFTISAPIYVHEIEEKIARKMQRYAINAFLSERLSESLGESLGDRSDDKREKTDVNGGDGNGKCDELRMFGTPLFVKPDDGVMERIADVIQGRHRWRKAKVVFKAGYLSRYHRVLRAYASSLRSADEIYENARKYLRRSEEFLRDVAERCVNGDYYMLRAMMR